MFDLWKQDQLQDDVERNEGTIKLHRRLVRDNQNKKQQQVEDANARGAVTVYVAFIPIDCRTQILKMDIFARSE